MLSSIDVLHVIAGDTPAARLETLKALSARPGSGRRRVLCLGSHTDCTGLGAVEYLTTPLGISRLLARRLRTAIPPADRTVLHVWSAKALAWLAPALADGTRLGLAGKRIRRRILMDAEAPLDLRRLAAALSRLRSEAALRFVCATETRRRRLRAVGIPADECVVIRDSVDFAALDAARASEPRARLNVLPEQAVALVLPPVARATGAFVAAWAAMLLAQVRPDVRLVLPDVGREVDRVVRLVDACRHRWLLRCASSDFTLSELVAAANLAVYLPSGDAPLWGVIWAMAAGLPIVASAVPLTAEILTDGQSAWLCPPEKPKEAAARMLRVLDNPQQSQRLAESARAQVVPAFGRRRMIDQYLRAYENLLADRHIADGIADAALKR